MDSAPGVRRIIRARNSPPRPKEARLTALDRPAATHLPELGGAVGLLAREGPVLELELTLETGQNNVGGLG
jgi:hypothetical protein